MFPTSHLKTLANEAAPGHEWSPDCVPILDEHGAQAVRVAARVAAANCKARGKKRVMPEDFNATPTAPKAAKRERKDATAEYIEWLEMRNEMLTTALKAEDYDIDIILKNLPPCPGIPQVE